VKLLLLY